MSHGDKFYPELVHNRNAAPENKFYSGFRVILTFRSKTNFCYQRGVNSVQGCFRHVKKTVHRNDHWEVPYLSTILSRSPRFVFKTSFLKSPLPDLYKNCMVTRK